MYVLITVQRGDGRSQRLDILVSEAEKRVVDLTANVLNGSASNSAISSNSQKASVVLCSVNMDIVRLLMEYFNQLTLFRYATICPNIEQLLHFKVKLFSLCLNTFSTTTTQV